MDRFTRRASVLAAAALSTVVAQIAVNAAVVSTRRAPAPLAASEVSRVARAHEDDVRVACWTARHAGSDARVRIELEVAPDGAIAGATVSQSHGDPAVGECVLGVVSGWHFPKSGAGGRFVLPFELSDGS